MDTSRPTSAEEQKTRMTSNANQYAYQENAYHQKPPSFNHKQVNISLVDDGNNNKKQQQKNKEKQQASGEWRESIPIKLEHLLFNFKENSLKVYKSSPPRIMQIFALIAALLLFCGVLALILSQRDDNLKKEANLPLDQSAIAERIIGESQLLNSKLKNSLFEQKNQTALNEKSKKLKTVDPKDAAVRKAFGSLLFSNDDNDEIEPDQEENNSDEFEGERTRSRNFNLFLSDNERPSSVDDKQPNEQTENPKLMFIERLMGLHFGLQPKFGLSESLVIRKTIDENASTDAGEINKAPENEMEFLLNSRSNRRLPNQRLSKEKETKNEDPTFLLRYAAAAMLSRVLQTAQQQAYIQQLQEQQQRFKEMNEKQMYTPQYRGYRPMREPIVEEASYVREPMYGRPMHQRHSAARPPPPPMFNQSPFQQLGVSSDRGYSRGPLITSEEAETQQIHPIILMLNLPYGKDQQTTSAAGAQLMLMSPGQTIAHPAIETTPQPILMPYAAAARQNPYYKPREQSIYNPFAHKNYYPQSPHQSQSGYYSHYPSHNHHHHHQHNPYMTANTNYRPRNQTPPPPPPPSQRLTNTIELPIEIHQVGVPSVSSPAMAQNTQTAAQIIVQPQIETAQPNENDQSAENEHHMVVFYSDADNLNHSEENNQSNNQNLDNQPQQSPVFVKENKQINQDQKMLLLHFVNPNENPQSNQMDTSNESQQQPSVKPFLVQQQQQQQQQPNEKQINSKLEEMILPIKSQQQVNKEKEIKNEEESNNEREEIYEKQENPSNSDVESSEPTSLAHFAEAIRHVIDQQQQNQEQQRPTIQPISITQQSNQPQTIQSATQQPQQSNSEQVNSNFQPIPTLIHKDAPIENSNKEVEKAQESRLQSPIFMVPAENEEN